MTVLFVASTNCECTHACAFEGKTIFAQADGSSILEFFRLISSITVTLSPLVRRVTTSLVYFAWPRTLTLLATTVAEPGTSGSLRTVKAGSGFLTIGFFAAGFLAGGLAAVFFAAGAFVFTGAA